jgi:hypothetical protein
MIYWEEAHKILLKLEIYGLMPRCYWALERKYGSGEMISLGE